jgi:uncharacterized protein
MIVQSILGGALIGLSAAILLIFNGRIMGSSGISSTFVVGLFEHLWSSKTARTELIWRGLFLTGLIAGAFALRLFNDSNLVSQPTNDSVWKLALAGLLVGVGTRMGWGCTSGHGVCGIGRKSGRSLVATVVFMLAGMITVYLAKGA